MTGCSDTGIHYYRHVGLLDDDAQEITGLQSLVCPDGCSQRHDCGRSGFFQMFAKRRVGLTIRQYDKAQLHQLLRGLQGLRGIGQQITRVGMNFQLQPIRTECLACHLGGEHGFFGIPDTRRVRQ